MHEIHSQRLWLGHAIDVRGEPRALLETGIAAIVDVAYEEPAASPPRSLIYCRFPIHDGAGNDSSVLLQAVQCANDFMAMEVRTLIACSAGMSRSPSIAAYALAAHLGQDPSEVIARIGKVKALDVHPVLWSDLARVFHRVRKNR